MRLIDADDYKDVLYGKRNNPSIRNGIASAITMLGKQPTIDAVEVVRCKDCKHYHAELGWCDEHSHFIDSDREFCYPHESTEWKMFEPDEWCSRAERKDGEG